MMDGRTFKADNRKELEQAILDSGQEPAEAFATAGLLWESMLKTQMELDAKQETKDYCRGCEHPEVVDILLNNSEADGELLRMLFKKTEELEKRVNELEKNQIESNREFNKWLNRFRKLIDAKTDI